MEQRDSFTLTNPQTGNLAFKLCYFERNNPFEQIDKHNYYSLIWIQQGSGIIKADFNTYTLTSNTLLSFSPHQPFLLEADYPLSGLVINFHPDFFCIHKHQKEVACHGVLFNNIYNPPFVAVNAKAQANFNIVVEQIKIEMQNPALAQYELLVSYLKIFLITASRLKTEQQTEIPHESSGTEEPFILQNLKN